MLNLVMLTPWYFTARPDFKTSNEAQKIFIETILHNVGNLVQVCENKMKGCENLSSGN